MIFPHPSGILALDIDGTVTAEIEDIPIQIKNMLHSWHIQGWEIIFITGRPFQWSDRTLRSLPFPYTLGVQNGAYLLKMPSQKLLASQLLNKKILSSMQSICQLFQTGFVVYGGYQTQDLCYYIPSDFSSELNDYLQKRNKKLGEKWQALNSWNELPMKHFASTKCFAKESTALKMSQKIEQSLRLHAPINRDSFDQNYFVTQATHPQATKGKVLQNFKQLINGQNLRVVAAGNDYNDQSLLNEANIKIVMADAPDELLKNATIVAPSAHKMGLLQGLEMAQDLLEKH